MTTLLSSGVELMLVGMGIVYSFLAMLVVAVAAMSYVLRRYFPDAPHDVVPQTDKGGEDAGVTAAISAAVHRYRATHKH